MLKKIKKHKIRPSDKDPNIGIIEKSTKKT